MSEKLSIDARLKEKELTRIREREAAQERIGYPKKEKK